MARRLRRRARGLVIGHLERVSSAVFDTHSAEITELVGARHGIYALYRNRRLYYVGLATNLKSRIRHHLRDRHAGRWNYFSLYLVRSERNLKELESLAIRIAYPRGNKTRGKFVGAPDLRKSLQNKMKLSAAQEIRELMGRNAPTPGDGEGSRTHAARKAWRTRRRTNQAAVPALNGLLANKRLRLRYKGKDHFAWVNRSGSIRLLATGQLFMSPSGAAKAIRSHSNGWNWWRFKNGQGEWTRLAELR